MSAPFVIRPDTNQVCKAVGTGRERRSPGVLAGAATEQRTMCASHAHCPRLYSTQDLFLSTFVPGDSNLWHKAKAG